MSKKKFVIFILIVICFHFLIKEEKAKLQKINKNNHSEVSQKRTKTLTNTIPEKKELTKKKPPARVLENPKDNHHHSPDIYDYLEDYFVFDEEVDYQDADLVFCSTTIQHCEPKKNYDRLLSLQLDFLLMNTPDEEAARKEVWKTPEDCLAEAQFCSNIESIYTRPIPLTEPELDLYIQKVVVPLITNQSEVLLYNLKDN